MKKSARGMKTVGQAVTEAHRPLFHYTKLGNAVSILQMEKMQMSRATKANDPYECKVMLKSEGLTEQCVNLLGSEILKAINGESSRLDGSASFEALKKKASITQAGTLVTSKETFKNVKKWIVGSFGKFDEGMNALLKIIRESVRFCCFCQSGTNLSLWGYYGDSGKGACLVFAFPKAQWSTHLLEVTYQKSLPVFLTPNDWIDILFKKTSLTERQTAEAIARKVTSTKSEDWQHEDEVRFVLFSDPSEEKEEWVTFPRGEIIGVLAGYRISDADYSSLKKEARRLKIPYGKVKQNDFEYTLHVD